MKKKLGKAEIICIQLTLFFFLQLAFFSFIRNTSSPPLQIQVAEHKRWRPQVTSSSQTHISLLSLKHPQQDHRILTSETNNPPPPPPAALPDPDPDHQRNPISCDRSHRLYDSCHLRLPATLDPTSATFFTTPTLSDKPPLLTEKIKPYPRKSDARVMSKIREITLTTSAAAPRCQILHETPALVFSIGGFTGNFFHDFNEGFIPLFITLNTLFPNHQSAITLVIADYNDWWYYKYEAILPRFSNHPIIILNNLTTTHCFTSVAAGLISHGHMTINKHMIKNKKSFSDFRALLEDAYRPCPAWPAPKVKGRPRLVIISRAGAVGRVLLNQEAIVQAAQEEGFEVVVFEPTSFSYLCQVYRLMNSSHVMVGVHGAALTHALFLRRGAVLVQVVPLGNEWLARTYYKRLASGMGLEYLDYRVNPNESTLAEKYGVDHFLVRNATDAASKNWSTLFNVYLKGQDVGLDVGRFKGYLRRAFPMAKRLMVEQGLHVKRRRGRVKEYLKPLVYS